MKFLRANAPTLPLLHVQQIAREHFGLRGDAKALYSERDQNTLFREADGRAWMLKIANTDEDPGAIDCQIEVLRHIQRVDPLLPAPQRSLVMEVLRQGIDAVLPRLDALRAQAIHGDLHAHNLILSETGDLAGIIDFGDMIHGPLILDLSAALADFMVPATRIPQVLADMIRGYYEVTPLEAEDARCCSIWSSCAS